MFGGERKNYEELSVIVALGIVVLWCGVGVVEGVGETVLVEILVEVCTWSVVIVVGCGLCGAVRIIVR